MTRKGKCFFATASLAGLGFLFVSAIGAVFCQGTLHVQRRFGPKPRNATEVSLRAADGANLSAWWLTSPLHNGNCVIVLHGIADSRVGSVGFAPMFLEHGYRVLAPDSRGHGMSEGSLVTYGLLEQYDVLSWVAWMQTNGCRNVYGLGESLGASILIQAVALQPALTAIVAEGAYADLGEAAEYRTRRMLPVPAFTAPLAAGIVVGSGMLYARAVYGLNFRDASPVRSIARVSVPILLIHGLNDSRTPSYNSERLARANPHVQLWRVPNAEHTGAYAADPAEFTRRVLGWFAQYQR